MSTESQSAGLQRIPPMVHWCEDMATYLNIPVDRTDAGRRIGECPYCGELLWEEFDERFGIKGGRLPKALRRHPEPED